MTTTASRLPTAKDAEQQVIGSLLIEPPLIEKVARVLRVDDFTDPAHRATYKVLTELCRKGLPISAVIVKQHLDEDATFSTGEPPAAYLYQLGCDVVTTAHVDYHMGLIANASKKRRLHSAVSFAAESALNGKPVNEVLCDLGAAVDDLQREDDSKANAIESYPLNKFIEQDHKTEFLIEGCITVAQPGVFAARSKALKTTVALDAALSIATGRKFLGKFWVPEAHPCGIISAESGGATLSESFQRIATAKELFVSGIENLHVSTKMPPLKTPEGRASLERFIEEKDLRCVFVDPTYKALPGVDDTQLSKMSEHLFPISDIVDRTGCSIVMVHHNKKTPRQPGAHYVEPTIEDIQGSGYQQWGRFFLLLNKRREWEPSEGRHWLWLRMEGSAGFGSRHFLDVHEGRYTDAGGRVWDIELSDPCEGAEREKQERKATQQIGQMEADRSAVCDLLAKHPEGLTKTKAKTLSGVSGRRWSDVLKTMFKEGDIETTEVIVSNHKTPHDGIKLTTIEDF